jgi:hypothetical protein
LTTPEAITLVHSSFDAIEVHGRSVKRIFADHYQNQQESMDQRAWSTCKSATTTAARNSSMSAVVFDRQW